MLVPQILFLGFFIRIDQMPVFLQWAQYLVATKYVSERRRRLLLVVNCAFFFFILEGVELGNDCGV